MPKDFHCILKSPHEEMLKEIEQHLFEQAGNSGVAKQYESKAMRLCIMTTHKHLFPHKHK